VSKRSDKTDEQGRVQCERCFQMTDRLYKLEYDNGFTYCLTCKDELDRWRRPSMSVLKGFPWRRRQP